MSNGNTPQTSRPFVAACRPVRGLDPSLKGFSRPGAREAAGRTALGRPQFDRGSMDLRLPSRKRAFTGKEVPTIAERWEPLRPELDGPAKAAASACMRDHHEHFAYQAVHVPWNARHRGVVHEPRAFLHGGKRTIERSGDRGTER